MGPTPIKRSTFVTSLAREIQLSVPLPVLSRSWLGAMVLLTDRGPSGYLPDVWASLKASAAANPDVPTVLLLVALDVDALSACAILMVRGLGPRAVPAAAYTRPPHTILPLGAPPHSPQRALRPLFPCPVQRLLEAEQIPHKVKPVSDYRNLGDIYVEQIANSTDVRQATPPPYGPSPGSREAVEAGAHQRQRATPVPPSPRSCEAS